jgi:hypothetical protein
MGKVSVGLRGWRFDEDAIFTDDGLFKELEEIPLDARQRLIRLVSLIEKPCDACHLIHGDEEIHRATQAAVVYGEPGEEVLLCDDHEADFVYWYQEAGGSDYRGEPDLADAFYEWFADGGRAPDDFGTVDHVETDPDDLPDLPNARELQAMLEENYEPHRIDLRDYIDDDSDADEEAEDRITADDLGDIDTEYPTTDE